MPTIDGALLASGEANKGQDLAAFPCSLFVTAPCLFLAGKACDTKNKIITSWQEVRVVKDAFPAGWLGALERYASPIPLGILLKEERAVPMENCKQVHGGSKRHAPRSLHVQSVNNDVNEDDVASSKWRGRSELWYLESGAQSDLSNRGGQVQ